jgi:curved DNA-binding protein CbpA
MDDRPDVDLYELLEVPRDATTREIRRSYRRLARRHHPDLNPHPDGPQRFAALADAYEILHDPARRARYDHTRGPTLAVGARRAPPPPTWEASVQDPIARRGILELSPEETRHLAHHALALRDAAGRTIVLPMGTAHGDQITFLHDGRALILTVRAKT